MVYSVDLISVYWVSDVYSYMLWSVNIVVRKWSLYSENLYYTVIINVWTLKFGKHDIEELCSWKYTFKVDARVYELLVDVIY